MLATWGLWVNRCRGLNGDDGGHVAVETQSEEKRKKKKRKKAKTQLLEGNTKQEQISTGGINQSSLEKEEKTELQPSQVRTFGNGLVVEELSMGKPDGKKASLGKKVNLCNCCGDI